MRPLLGVGRPVVTAVLASTLVLAAATTARAAPGAPDTTFNGTGFAVAPIALAATGVGVQADGKIVTVGGQLNLARFECRLQALET
jgi:hypothetical protein